MGYAERRQLYKEVEIIRGRPLLTYITNSRIGSTGIMSSDVIPEFCHQISNIPQTEKNIDILIVSNGGDPITAWRIISVLRERFEKVGVLVPFVAQSAATLLALGADDIVMHPFASFGPVDPQITVNPSQPGQNPLNFSADCIDNFLEFVKKDAKTSHFKGKENPLHLLCEKVSPIDIGLAKKSMKLTKSLSKKLLSTHMSSNKKQDTIVKALNTSFYHHGYTIRKEEAKSLGLPITNSTQELENLIWDIWIDFEKEMKIQTPFDPLTEILTTEKYADKYDIKSSQPLSAESYEKLLSTIANDSSTFLFELCHAALESTSAQSRYISIKEFRVFITDDIKINNQLVQICNGYWRRY